MRSTPAAARTSTNNSAIFFATPGPLPDSRFVDCILRRIVSVDGIDPVVKSCLSCRSKVSTDDAPSQSRTEAVMVIQSSLRHCEDCRSNESTMEKYNCPGSGYN